MNGTGNAHRVLFVAIGIFLGAGGTAWLLNRGEDTSGTAGEPAAASRDIL